MKPLSIFISLVLVIASLQATGQNVSTRKNRIYISPLRAIDFVNPGIELGYERLYGRHSSEFSLGWMRDFINMGFDEYTGIRLGVEQKRFFLKEAPGSYIAAGLVYMDTRYQDGKYYFDSVGPREHYSDTFNVKKKTYSLNIKAGMQVPIKRFLLDLQGGLGLKYKSVTTNEQPQVNAKEIPPRHFNAYYLASREGNYLSFNLPMQIRLAYTF